MADSHETPLNPQENTEETSSEEDPAHHLVLDLGDETTIRLESQQMAGASSTRREDNPFSFKHFLRSDTNATAPHHQGARPKVFCEGRPVASVSELEFAAATRGVVSTEYVASTAALPDFVQDHLVVEQQCYGTVNNNSQRGLDLGGRRGLDLTTSEVAGERQRRCRKGGFPLDLAPVDVGGERSEVGVSKSLPDFLADGAVRPQNSDIQQPVISPEHECDRLRQHIDILRHQVIESNHRIESLTRELDTARSNEHDYTQNLAKALEQVEKNLEKSNIRTATAENTIAKLRYEIKSLTNQLNSVKMENRALRGEEGAAGGGGQRYFEPIPSQRLAQELKAAASTAEHSLRQLLTGVDNLRIMASTLENMHRLEEKPETYLDLDEDTGPAL